MNLVMPILFAAVLVGAFARRMTPRLWWGLGFWILLVVAYHFVKS